MRLRDYDYSRPGYYFITICTANRSPIFGQIKGDEMVDNRYAGIVRRCWEELPAHYPHAHLDAFVIMPNHVHGIFVLADTYAAGGVWAGLKPAPTDVGIRRGLPEMVRALKTYSARRINASRRTLGAPVWQRGYYERIIRNERQRNLTREYIIANPRNWQKDREQHKTHRQPHQPS